MFTWIKQYGTASAQTKYFILTLAIYFVVMIWTTIQSYSRLEYSRTTHEVASPIEYPSNK